MKTVKFYFTAALAVCFLTFAVWPVRAESVDSQSSSVDSRESSVESQKSSMDSQDLPLVSQDSFLLRVWNRTGLNIAYLRFDYYLGDAQQGYVLCCPNEGEDFYRFELSKDDLYSLEQGKELKDFRAECSYCVSELNPEDVIQAAMMGKNMGEVRYQTFEMEPVLGEVYDYLLVPDSKGSCMLRLKGDETAVPEQYPVSFNDLKALMEDYDWKWCAARDAKLDTLTYYYVDNPNVQIAEIRREDGSTGFVTTRTDKAFKRTDGSLVRRLYLSLGLYSDLWTEADSTLFWEKEWGYFWDLCGRLINEKESAEMIRSEVEKEISRVGFASGNSFSMTFRDNGVSLVFSAERFQTGWIFNLDFNNPEP